MKTSIFLLAFIMLVPFGCQKGVKTVSTTKLGDGTPYYAYLEVMAGKVKQVSEKNYWAIPGGDSYTKGALLTKADRDSLGGWTRDFDAMFDETGNLISCIEKDGDGINVWKNENIIESNKIVRRNYLRNDTIRSYDVFEYDEKGFLKGGKRFRAGVDTLLMSVKIQTDEAGIPLVYETFTFDGSVSNKYAYSFNELNQFVKYKVIGPDGNLVFSYDMTYNELGKIDIFTMRDKDNNVSAINECSYELDEKGNWVKAFLKDPKKNLVVLAEREYVYFEQ